MFTESAVAGEPDATEMSRILIRLPREQHRELAELVAKHGLTMQAVGELALIHAVEELRAATGGDVSAPLPVPQEPPPVRYWSDLYCWY